MSKNRVVVIVEGGVVQNVMVDSKEVDVLVIDYDVDGLTQDLMTEFPTGCGGDDEMAVGYVYEGTTEGEFNPGRVEELFNAANR